MTARKPKRELAENIAAARKAFELLAVGLPNEVWVSGIGTLSKGPYLAFCLREALSYRMVEMTRNACAALERNERSVAIVLARCGLENLALMRHLLRTLDRRDEMTSEALHEVLHKMLVGGRLPGNPTDAPIAFNVITMLDKMDKELPGIRSMYDDLSEVAHPNYGGVHALFAKINPKKFCTTFGPTDRGEPMGQIAGAALASGAELYNLYYDRVGDALEAWIPTLPKIKDT